MRLDDYDPNAISVGDQRGSGMSLGGAGGKIGCGSIVIALIGYFVFGADPMSTLSQMQGQSSAPVATQGGKTVDQSCTIDKFSKDSCDALSSLNKTWAPLFKQANIPFQGPKLWFYSQMGRSGCGTAQSAMGPFYCPEDRGIYLDTDFYNQLDKEMGAKGGFARDYVIAHEYGHHVQNLLGMSDQVRSAQGQNPGQANALSVRLELQADCYAGVWAAKNKDRLDPGDMESGLNAAHQIGDDVLMQAAGRNPNEAGFTHGSSAQRMQWLRKGMETGNEDACNTFADLQR